MIERQVRGCPPGRKGQAVARASRVLLAAFALTGCGDGALITLGQVAVVRPIVDAAAGADTSIILPCPQCQTCEAGKRTTVSGTIFDPAGKVPLYNVIVYVPSRATLDPIQEGVTCDRCAGTAVAPLAVTLTDAAGKFQLVDTPTGQRVRIVIQIGKWRREVEIPEVVPCQDNVITDRDLTRLPRHSAEGHLPRIALTTGHSDALECLLRKIGIDDREFTTDAGAGRVHMFVGCDGGKGFGANRFTPALGGAMFADASALWSDPAKLMNYDMLVLSCEGSQCEGQKPDPYTENIKRYADAGGRLFLDHLHFYWLLHGPPPWPMTADYIGPNGDDLPSPFTAKVDSSFPKGAAFAEWLVQTGASSAFGNITIRGAQFSVRSAYPPETQRWIYTDQNPTDPSNQAVEYMTMNTPVEVATSNPESQCGRAVYTDLHVVIPAADAGAIMDVSRAEMPFPSGCVAADLTPQEKALEFMLFDLSSCVQEEKEQPKPPIR
jgi:hypothetical protein